MKFSRSKWSYEIVILNVSYSVVEEERHSVALIEVRNEDISWQSIEENRDKCVKDIDGERLVLFVSDYELLYEDFCEKLVRSCKFREAFCVARCVDRWATFISTFSWGLAKSTQQINCLSLRLCCFFFYHFIIILLFLLFLSFSQLLFCWNKPISSFLTIIWPTPSHFHLHISISFLRRFHISNYLPSYWTHTSLDTILT